jgi:RecA-family ATPase
MLNLQFTEKNKTPKGPSADQLAFDHVEADQYNPNALFHIYKANQWMAMEQEAETPQMLFGRFWLQGELCILFADTNMGKSILAVQLGQSIAAGQAIPGFEMNAEPGPVLYIDFELAGKQFEQRYTDERGTFRFSDNFMRGEYNQLYKHYSPTTRFNDDVIEALTRGIKTTGATVLIIDNITCMRKGTERANEALPLMKQLKYLKTRHGLSILVLAHTPKRNPAMPISRNDLQGSKMLINFADSAFAIGESNKWTGYRYLKQIKQRSTQETYGAENVVQCKLVWRDSFLQFNFEGTCHELDHLLTSTQQLRDRNANQVAQLHAQGLSQRQIAARLKLGLATVNKMIGWARGE